ncbi:putative methionine transporter, NhaC family [Porphyromonadaceae bacterium NLAE-zl-C104]|uniref:Na+/H+ antiporter NhaC family protein n=1 Tax=Proteiniphilum TaxID=294702 RepID=UPI00089C7554|nr:MULTISPECIES: Na+/H+ antiporter NhaC family protein [Proteiniphilum]MDY9919922.1 Na+/H+ antiporter NhaC family protein [Proteiniphilum sp.]SEA37426.1 putative methionine transporter, NhaC family [Porphyromonadaceae bacterium KH3R12]SFT07139.1 putative methionine transporter, NhaC family [Porphyromonadaceae bacterium NLAE-zl-C104]
MDPQTTGNKGNGWALLPFAIFFILYAITFATTRDLRNMPVSVAFTIATAVAILSVRRTPFPERLRIFSKGAGNETIMLMVVIFILAGAFSAIAGSMGAVDATVNLILYTMPPQAIMAGLFAAACVISMSMGTSSGTVAALAPIAVGISGQTDIGPAMILGVVIGGAMFGDNLSFISDTTIVVTKTQGCKMTDKFRVNSMIVIPMAIIMVMIYIFMGRDITVTNEVAFDSADWIKVIPYLVVLITALAGVDVIIVLLTGIILSSFFGLVSPDFSVWDLTLSAKTGIVSDMGELIIVTIMAGGVFEVIKYNKGIDWLIHILTRKISSKRGAEFSIAGLVMFTNFCTANNTIACIITGPIAKDISTRFELDNRKTASLMDTFSCFVQGMIPYGAQLLIAAGIANINPVEIVPKLYYPFLTGIAATIAITLRYPKRYS